MVRIEASQTVRIQNDGRTPAQAIVPLQGIGKLRRHGDKLIWKMDGVILMDKAGAPDIIVDRREARNIFVKIMHPIDRLAIAART